MDKLEFITILESSLIKFDMKLSHIHGSVYFQTKFGVLRIADHPKPYGYEMGSMKDFRSYSEAYDFLLKKGAINLNKKEDKEKKIKEYESLCKEELLNGEICYKSPSGRFFVTKNDAASSFWHEKKTVQKENKQIKKFIKDFQEKNEYKTEFLDNYNLKFKKEFKEYLLNNDFHPETLKNYKKEIE